MVSIKLNIGWSWLSNCGQLVFSKCQTDVKQLSIIQNVQKRCRQAVNFATATNWPFAWFKICNSLLFQGWLKVPYNVGIPTFKYEKIELLVCIYEISRELVFIYEISGCSWCLTPVTLVNHYHTLKKGTETGYRHLSKVRLEIGIQTLESGSSWSSVIIALPEVSPYWKSWKYI